MASKYHQKFPVPENFQEVIHDFAREVIRSQTPDILDFAFNYFSLKAEGKEYKFESKFNVSKKEHPKQYNVIQHDKLEQAHRVVNSSNKNQVVETKQVVNANQNVQQVESTEHQHVRQTSSKSNKSNGSNQSGNVLNASKGSHTTHPEEKGITREFMGDLYSSAIGQAIEGQEQDFEGSNVVEQQFQQEEEENNHSGNRELSHTEEKIVAKEYSSQVFEQAIEKQSAEGSRNDQQLDEKALKQKALEEAGLEGDVEDFERAALKIQGKFKSKKYGK